MEEDEEASLESVAFPFENNRASYLCSNNDDGLPYDVFQLQPQPMDCQYVEKRHEELWLPK